MHAFTFYYKSSRRLRGIWEQMHSDSAFNFDSLPESSVNIFSLSSNIKPFLPSIDIPSILSENKVNQLLSKADIICDHQFDLLGSGPFVFPNGIDWHSDFKNGFKWPSHVLYSMVRSKTTIGADIKVPWELSRFYHATTLAVSWKCTENTKYSSELFDQIDNWIDNNPIGFGVNWACPMEVGIRAINWIIALSLLAEPLSESSQDDFRLKVINSLWKHANFLRTHLEWNGRHADSGANHLLFNFIALFSLGVLFKDSEKGKHWIQLAHSHLEKQMERQVYADGVHFECSIGYHRLCLEAFLWCSNLAERMHQPFSSSFYLKLSKMQGFVSDYTKTSGKAPLVGDNDDGRLLNTGILPLSNHNYLLPESDSGSFYLDRFLLDGTISVGPRKIASPCSAYSKSGFFFFRNLNADLLVRAGVIAFDGTHAHNDQLSFELSINAQDVFVDRGTHQYSANSDLRNLYRSTEAHNTLQINDLEQNQLSSAIFTLSDQTKTTLLEETKSSIRCMHSGFNYISTSNHTHERNFKLNKNELLIRDVIGGVEYQDTLNWYFHLAPNLKPLLCNREIQIYIGSKQICAIKPDFEADATFDCFQHSPSFGILEDAVRIHVMCVLDGNSPSSFSFTISWE